MGAWSFFGVFADAINADSASVSVVERGIAGEGMESIKSVPNRKLFFVDYKERKG